MRAQLKPTSNNNNRCTFLLVHHFNSFLTVVTSSKHLCRSFSTQRLITAPRRRRRLSQPMAPPSGDSSAGYFDWDTISIEDPDSTPLPTATRLLASDPHPTAQELPHLSTTISHSANTTCATTSTSSEPQLVAQQVPTHSRVVAENNDQQHLEQHGDMHPTLGATFTPHAPSTEPHHHVDLGQPPEPDIFTPTTN